jgi:hypothetical protein
MSRVNEHGVIFQGWGVRAILEGHKTQTRRAIRNPEKYEGIRECAFCCPYGQSGDLLWVRETWKPHVDKTVHTPAIYRADYTHDRLADSLGPWRPSIHMPRWASRLTLHLTDVRVQRVQEISEEDAQAEGVEAMYLDDLGQTWKSYRRGFESIWDSINAKRGYGWTANPWIWALTFERA